MRRVWCEEGYEGMGGWVVRMVWCAEGCEGWGGWVWCEG